jgi:transcription-repair coupling factor (superfamily II helicase)
VEETGLESLEASLASANASMGDLLRALEQSGRADVTSIPAGALSWAVARAVSEPPERRFAIVTPDLETAYRFQANLRFFLEPGAVAVFAAADTSPLLDVVPDRRAEMLRMAALSRLIDARWAVLILPAVALPRRVPPRHRTEERRLRIEFAQELDREELVSRLLELGYLRVPLVEDMGTFSSRGAIVDVFPAGSKDSPYRIELDDERVERIRAFDPDDQKTGEEVEHIALGPAREIPDEAEAIARAKKAVRALCDDMNMPTLKAREIIDELDRGSGALISNALLPAYYEQLGTVFDYIPADAHFVLWDPLRIQQALSLEEQHAEREHAARSDRPTFAMGAHYLEGGELLQALRRHSWLVAHRLAIHGDAEEDEGHLLSALAAPSETLMRVDASDHAAMIAELRQHKGMQGMDRALQPLADRLRGWSDQGLQVTLVSRTRHQADRLVDLLRGYGLGADVLANEAEPAQLRREGPHVFVRLGELRDGFVSWGEGQAFVTEEEVFGGRVRKPRDKRLSRRQQQRFLEDLRELDVGDFVVHVEHGVGKYLGLQHRELSLSAFERLKGHSAQTVEVMLIEYAGGDRLFVPVTRLGIIQKFKGKDGAKPKLDRLGGQTFASKKSRVKRAVQQMAEELLKLYAERNAARRDPLEPAGPGYAEFEATFPFEETRDQARAIEEVLSDLEAERPMDRLVCGDVGFGKTEVAMRAAFRVAMGGQQVAFLCPTTVLAQQHFRTISSRFDGYPFNIRVLSRFVPRPEQLQTLAGLKDGTVDIVVGTHRVLSKDVHFAKLGLLVVDEEQRFGVTHKERIKKLRTNVDVITLSATPIPRTLQLAIGGMRDLSLIATAPQDRRAVRTFVCRWDDELIKEALERELSRGGQVFFVYNRIEGLHERAERLQALVPRARIAVAHGQMTPALLDRTMTDFIDGAYDVLCATAIIESGLDIPRANTMLIDRADAMGLAQLYQLRGRVGRSDQRAYCYLITPPPNSMSEESRIRMEALEQFSGLGAGFRVATLDMELRGAGNLLGSEQSGNASLVGFDMFVQMLNDAVSELRGEQVQQEVDPELSLELEHYLPEDYVDDIGLRLSLYRRFATAEDEQAVQDLAEEMEQRFGSPPAPAREFVRVMSLKPLLRELRVLGCEANDSRVTLHLREDTPLDPAKLMPLMARAGQEWTLSPDMKLTRRYPSDEDQDAVDRVRLLMRELQPLRSGGVAAQN